MGKDRVVELGEKLKAIRVEKKMTLGEVAEKSSLTRSFISQIELNKTSPSIASLMKVASSLGVRLSDLFEEEHNREDVLTKKGKRETYYNTKTQLTLEPLFTRRSEQKMEPLYLRFEPGGKTNVITRTGQEFVYIIKGKVKLILDRKEYIAEEGDSLCFKSSIPHSWENSWSETVEGIWVVIPPVF